MPIKPRMCDCHVRFGSGHREFQRRGPCFCVAGRDQPAFVRCGEPFIPRKRNAAICVGTKCQQRAYDKRRAKTLKRRKYQREYRKKERSKGQLKPGDDNKNRGGS